jgi:outer membrane lipoprotein carrier protein
VSWFAFDWSDGIRPWHRRAAQKVRRQGFPVSRVALLGVGLLYFNSGTIKAQVLTPESVAARVDRHYNALHSLRVTFVQQYDGLGQHRRESGTLLLKKPGRMRWDYSQPPGKLFVLDGKYAYFYSPGQMEVQRVAAKKLDDLRSPLRFLLGHAEIAKELAGLRIATQGETYELSGVPRNMEQRVSSLELTVTGDGAIRAIKIEELDGSVSTFSFTGEQANPVAADSDFVFRAPPGTAVVDGPAPQ